jgi:hypothetical protein
VVLFHKSPLINYAILPERERGEKNAEVTFGQGLEEMTDSIAVAVAFAANAAVAPEALEVPGPVLPG